MTTILSSTLIEGAQVLADELVALAESPAGLTGPLPDSFMAHRPNSLAESYRHGQGVAQILAEWQADPALQAAGLLHSFGCKGALSADQIAQACDERVAYLCQAYQHILQQAPVVGRRQDKAYVLRRVKLFMAAYQDPDLAFLGVANLWDHFILARQSEPRLQRYFIDEARLILVPVLDMLGMWELKEEVEEWMMQHGSGRQDYQYLSKRLVQTEDTRQHAFELVNHHLQPKLANARLAPKVRSPVQIYKPQLPEKTQTEVLQKLTVDVLVDDEAACYQALRWIHHFWKPVEGFLTDYIGTSKLNGYRCLQTGVIVPLKTGHMRVHFHIRTYEMDRINRWGIAALQILDRYQVELPQAWWSGRSETWAKINSAALGALPEILYVFSPQGELFRFHRGCTVVDYAYQVHSEVAHRCKRFRVNGEVVGPTTILRHLDLVELEQDPQFPGPNRVWLTAARTSRARSHIERFLNRKGQGSVQGQKLLDQKLQELKSYYRLDIPEHRTEQALHQMARLHKLERPEDVLAEIAAGRLTSDQILHPLFAEEITRQVQLPPEMRLFPHQLNLAQCCKPRPGDNIVGRVRLRRTEVTGLKIHQAACPRIVDHARTIPLTWRLRSHFKTAARLEVTGLHETHLLDKVLQVLYTGLPHLILHKIEYVTRNGVVRLGLTVEAGDQSLIDQIARDLEQLPGRKINEVRQMQLLLSEREELARATPATFNPYRRLPVQDREMFFGRLEELASVYQLLRADVGAIFIQGHKRVGKTSLLLHLQKYYLKRNFAVPVYIDFQILGHLSGPAYFYYKIAHAVYSELQNDSRIGQAGPPLWELFKVAPLTELTNYLKSVQSHFGATKLVLLIDEFSRTIEAYQQHQIEDDFFQQWLGVLQATIPNVSYVMVIQQQAYNTMFERIHQPFLDPIWQLLEVGEMLPLNPLSEKDACQLIERPTYNHLEYSADALHYVWRLTGGSPFLIQTFCFSLVRYMARTGRRRVELADAKTVEAEFMHPNESIFAHLLDVIKDEKQTVCWRLTYFLDETDQPVPLAELRASLTELPAGKLLSVVHELAELHILSEPEPDSWQFASLLFGRWLARNAVLEQLGSAT